MRGKNSLRELKIEIGDIVFSVISNDPELKLKVDACYKQFITKAIPDIILRAHSGYNINPNLVEEVFDSGGNWTLFRSGEKLAFRLCSPRSNQFPYKIAVLESNFKSGDIYINKTSKILSVTPTAVNPFQYPLDEFLIINLLSLGLGILVHACGIKDNELGILFVGASGAGKSSLANLWKDKKDVTVLSDDRVIIRKINGCFWIYGTPWHGDAKVCSPEKAPLERIFFLNHAKRNKVKRVKAIDAVSKLLVYSFPTFWDKKGMKFTLNFCDELAKKIDCCDLGFVLDKSVVDFIRSSKV